ncbi:ABC transporter permease subunit [Pirellulales bacterium]|nr:ABC transporter permease subunit [Pirellulales bacterium]
MLLGPIFHFEAVTAARRPRYFLLRSLYGVIILLLLWSAYETSTAFSRGRPTSIQQAARVSTTLFGSLSWLQLLAILAVGPALAVGTISTERERRTIEYLFATDLSNAEIILGKAFARLALLIKLLLVALPVLFLIRMLGGIPANLLAGAFAISASTAVVITSFSVCVSVWSRRARDASARVYLLLIVFALLPALLHALGWAAEDFSAVSEALQLAGEFLASLNPLVVFSGAYGGSFSPGMNFDFAPILQMVGWHAAISVGSLALATFAVRRVHLRDSGRAEGGKKSKQGKSLRRLRWRPALGKDPMLWKEAFAGTSKTRLGVVGYFAILAIASTFLWSVLFAFFDRNARNDYVEMLALVSGFAGSGMILWLAARAAGLITHEKEQDCWMALLATPLTGSEIVLGKALGNLYAARWGIGLLAFAWVLGIIRSPELWFTAPLMGLAVLACTCFVTNLGIFFSLRSKTSTRAMAQTLGTLLFVGGGYLLCCCPLAMTGSGDAIMIGMAACMPFLMTAPALFSREIGMHEVELVIAFAFGVFGYTVAAVVLFISVTTDFDLLAGRTTGRDGPRP